VNLSAGGVSEPGAARQARLAIERFLAASAEPVLVESGEPPIALAAGNYTLEWRSGFLMLQVWDDHRNIARRVAAVQNEIRGKLDLAVERFGKRSGTISLVDMRVPRNADAGRRAVRMTYREAFRRALSRQFPGWRIADLSSAPDLEHSLSPRYTRALLRRGSTGWAAIGTPSGDDVDGVLTFGLVWLDYLRARERVLTVEGLALFLPASDLTVTCLRLASLNARAARFTVFAQSEDGYEEQIDPRDFGNLETRLERCRCASPEQPAHLLEWSDRLSSLQGVERVQRSDGSTSLRVRGLEFARVVESDLVWGLETKRLANASNLTEIERLAAELGRLRSVESSDHASSIYLRSTEGWLESQVRRELMEVDPTLLPVPVYGQAPTFAAGARDIIDLLATDHSGRLAVLELKAFEDIHLPLQALDYWMRVKWHAERGEFAANGYFPAKELRRDAPRLMLVAPALNFHPANEVVLRYFDPAIDVARIGVGMEWRKRLKVMFRYGAN
jgi:hypothetical protein